MYAAYAQCTLLAKDSSMDILVGNGDRLSGFLDWESTGYSFEDWGFTAASNFGVSGVRSSGFMDLGSTACGMALNSLTVPT